MNLYTSIYELSEYFEKLAASVIDPIESGIAEYEYSTSMFPNYGDEKRYYEILNTIVNRPNNNVETDSSVLEQYALKVLRGEISIENAIYNLNENKSLFDPETNYLINKNYSPIYSLNNEDILLLDPLKLSNQDLTIFITALYNKYKINYLHKINTNMFRLLLEYFKLEDIKNALIKIPVQWRDGAQLEYAKCAQLEYAKYLIKLGLRNINVLFNLLAYGKYEYKPSLQEYEDDFNNARMFSFISNNSPFEKPHPINKKLPPKKYILNSFPGFESWINKGQKWVLRKLDTQQLCMLGSLICELLNWPYENQQFLSSIKTQNDVIIILNNINKLKRMYELGIQFSGNLLKYIHRASDEIIQFLYSAHLDSSFLEVKKISSDKVQKALLCQRNLLDLYISEEEEEEEFFNTISRRIGVSPREIKNFKWMDLRKEEIPKKILENANRIINMIALKQAFTNYQIKEYYLDGNVSKHPVITSIGYTTLDGSILIESLDPESSEHFTIGIDTNCCQALGLAGESAVIDSFINYLAGVLVVRYNGKILSQSYFHYVPNDNGIILDNVETNAQLSKLIDLDDLYSAIAMNLQKDYGLKYCICGMGFNKLTPNNFEYGSMSEDPRSFEANEKYSDWKKEKFLNLLKPNIETNFVLQRTKPITRNKTNN